MAKVQVDARRIDAVLDAQWLAGLEAAFELLYQLVFRHDLLRAAADESELFGDGFHWRQSSVVRGRLSVATDHGRLTTDESEVVVADRLERILEMLDGRLALAVGPADAQDVETGGMAAQAFLLEEI